MCIKSYTYDRSDFAPLPALTILSFRMLKVAVSNRIFEKNVVKLLRFGLHIIIFFGLLSKGPIVEPQTILHTTWYTALGLLCESESKLQILARSHFQAKTNFLRANRNKLLVRNRAGDGVRVIFCFARVIKQLPAGLWTQKIQVNVDCCCGWSREETRRARFARLRSAPDSSIRACIG